MKKIVTLVLAMLSCLFVGAADKSLDTDSYFAFPRAVVVMESGSVKAIADCSRCFSHPTPQQPEPYFSGGHEFEGGVSVTWEFVRQTQRGDVYLITVERPSKSEVVTPILFTGKAQTVVSVPDLTVRILPERPKSK